MERCYSIWHLSDLRKFYSVEEPKNEFSQFLYAWGKFLRNKPVAQLAAPFIVVDPILFRLHGDYSEDACSYSIPHLLQWTDTGNTAEEAMAYSFLELSADGFNTPVLTLANELGGLTKEKAQFIVLPPIVKNTPKEILKNIRAAHERGIGLLAFESVAGLEDLFGIREHSEKINISSAGGEVFHHKCANALYNADGAQSILYGVAEAGGKENIPLVLTHQTRFGKTVFFNIPPTVLRRENFRQKLSYGEASINEAMRKGIRWAAEFLSPVPDVRTEHGTINFLSTVILLSHFRKILPVMTTQ